MKDAADWQGTSRSLAGISRELAAVPRELVAGKPAPESDNVRAAEHMIKQRTLTVVAILALVLLVHLDRFVAVAIDTDWVPTATQTRLANPDYECGANPCPRLPGYPLVVYFVLSLLVAVLPAAVVATFARREDLNEGTATVEASDRLASFLGRHGIGRQLGGSAPWLALSVACGIFNSVERYFYVVWSVETNTVANTAPLVITLGSISQLAFLLLGMAVAARRPLFVLHASVPSTESLWSPVRKFCARQRFNIIVAVLYMVALLVIGMTRDQAQDALRFIDITTRDGLTSALWLLASTALFSGVLLECGVRYEWQSEAGAETSSKPLEPAMCWIAAALIAAVAGIIMLVGAGGRPLMVLASILAGLAILGRYPRSLAQSSPPARAIQKSPSCLQDEIATAVRAIALIPAVVMIALTLVSSVDLLLRTEWRPAALLTPGLLVILLAALALLVPGDAQAEHLTRYWRRSASIAALTASVATITGASPTSEASAFAIPLMTALVLLMLMALSAKRFKRSLKSRFGSANHVAIALGLGVAFAVHVDPYAVGGALGSLALVNLTMAVATVGLFYIVRLTHLVSAPRALAWLGVRYFPVTTVLVLWIFGAGLAVPSSLNDIRLHSQQQGVSTALVSPSLRAVFENWRDSQPEFSAANRGSVSTMSTPVPMLLVATHGGGIRAAFWTALVLDCIVGVSAEHAQPFDTPSDPPQETCRQRRRTDDEQRSAANRILLASGVSGGSVGLHAFARQFLAGSLKDETWVDRRLGRDLLSPTVSWGLFHDLPNRLIGLSGRAGACGWTLAGRCLTRDRAAVLEGTLTLADDSPDEPMLRGVWAIRTRTDSDGHERERSLPLLIMNSTTPRGGLRAIASAADLGPWPNHSWFNRGSFNGNQDRPVHGAAEVSDMLCASKDITVATAAVLSARFPLVSSPGRIDGACGSGKGAATAKMDWPMPCAANAACETQMLDGGYYDNSGLITIAQLWPALLDLVRKHNSDKSHAPIAPVILSIDSHYQNEKAGPVKPSQESELGAIFAAQSQASVQVEQIARGVLLSAFPNSCLETIRPEAYPGLTAPLGWVLSSATRSDLRTAIVRPSPRYGATGNRYWLRRYQSWLEPHLQRTSQFQPELSACVPTENLVAPPASGPVALVPPPHADAARGPQAPN